jgi:hypothetical protein
VVNMADNIVASFGVETRVFSRASTKQKQGAISFAAS